RRARESPACCRGTGGWHLLATRRLLALRFNRMGDAPSSRPAIGARLTPGDTFLTLEDMSLIRGTSLQGFRELVSELGVDPDPLLAAAGIDSAAAGDPESFI